MLPIRAEPPRDDGKCSAALSGEAKWQFRCNAKPLMQLDPEQMRFRASRISGLPASPAQRRSLPLLVGPAYSSARCLSPPSDQHSVKEQPFSRVPAAAFPKRWLLSE